MAAQSSVMNAAQIVGRLAPSPTGALHFGNARSFLLAWLSARQAGGTVVLRIEDIDSPRVKPWAVISTIEDLAWLGLDWDAGPDKPSLDESSSDNPSLDQPMSGAIEMIQTRRLSRYNEILGSLVEASKVYPCTCTRSEVAEAASAPHESSLKPLEGPIYPGTCRRPTTDKSVESNGSSSHQAAPVPDREFAYRWAFEDAVVTWEDALRGQQSANPLRQLGDFVIAKSNGTPAYQLAVVVDDYDMGITEVVRGDDLIASTYRQLAILNFLQWPTPKYYHVPLMLGPDGKRLAKRHGDTRLSYFRELGISPQAIVGYLAWTLRITTELAPRTPRQLLGKLQWNQLPTTPTTFDLATDLAKLRELS